MIDYTENTGKGIKKEKPKVFLNWADKRISRNQNLIMIFNGGTGSGKSWASLRCACDLSEHFKTPFSISGNVDFSFESLLKKMYLPENNKPGTVFIQEEVGSAGSGASSREWQSKANKFFNSFLQTSRHKRQILIMNCPSFGYLEAGSRQLVHFQLESMGINPITKQSAFKPFAIQCNRRTGKLYYKYLRYKHEGGRKRVNIMRFGLPPDDIIRDYENEKTKFTDKLNKSIMEPEKKKVPLVNKEYRKEIADMYKDKGLTQKEISKRLGISEMAISHYYNRDKTTNNAQIA